MTNTLKVNGKTRREFLANKLVQLLYISGVSGDEDKVAKYLTREMESLNPDDFYVDSYGNLHTKFIMGDGNGATIHLNSHMDTVAKCEADKRITISESGVYRAINSDGQYGVLGADDRAGIATILTILNFKDLLDFNGTIKVSFYREEEIGCVGSSNSDLGFLKDVDFSITFDRHGSSDIVIGGMGQPFACDEVGVWLDDLSRKQGFEFTPCEGGISDACTVSETGVNAINLSVGYYNEHTTNEYLVFDELHTSMRFGFEIISDLNNVVHGFTSVPKENKWVKSWDYSYGGYSQTNTFPSDDSLFAPIAYIEGRYGVITDGNHDMVMSYEEVDELIYQLRQVRDELAVACMSDYRM